MSSKLLVSEVTFAGACLSYICRVNDYFLLRLLIVFSQFLRDFPAVMGTNPFVFQCEHQRVLPWEPSLDLSSITWVRTWKEFKFAVLFHRAVLSERKVRLVTLGEFCSWRQNKGVNESQVVVGLRLHLIVFLVCLLETHKYNRTNF